MEALPGRHCIAGVFFQMTYHMTNGNNEKEAHDRTCGLSFRNSHMSHRQWGASQDCDLLLALKSFHPTLLIVLYSNQTPNLPPNSLLNAGHISSCECIFTILNDESSRWLYAPANVLSSSLAHRILSSSGTIWQ